MKIPVILFISISSLSISAKTNYYNALHIGIVVHNNPVQSSLLNLLNLYYDLKNALVNSNATLASAKAGALLKAINDIDTKSLPANELKTFMNLRDKLSFDSRHIFEVQKIEHQREHFANLSLNMFALAKSMNLSGHPVYEDYCPMKKAYWLSAEPQIKNPYYGDQMPDCGEIKSTLPGNGS